MKDLLARGLAAAVVVAAAGAMALAGSARTPGTPGTSRELVFSTYLGGAGVDQARDVAADGKGNVYVVGGTSSRDFPVTPEAFDTTFNDAGTPPRSWPSTARRGGCCGARTWAGRSTIGRTR